MSEQREQIVSDTYNRQQTAYRELEALYSAMTERAIQAEQRARDVWQRANFWRGFTKRLIIKRADLAADYATLAREYAAVLEAREQAQVALDHAGMCPHGNFYETHDCIVCFGDGTERIAYCEACKASTWHRGGVCLAHDNTNAPQPFATLRAERDAARAEAKELRARLEHLVSAHDHEDLRGVLVYVPSALTLARAALTARAGEEGTQG